MVGAFLVFQTAVVLSLPRSTGPSAWRRTGASLGAVDNQSTRKRPSSPAEFARDDRERGSLGWSQRWGRGLAYVLAWWWCSFQNLRLSLGVRVRVWPGNESQVRICWWRERRAGCWATRMSRDAMSRQTRHRGSRQRGAPGNAAGISWLRSPLSRCRRDVLDAELSERREARASDLCAGRLPRLPDCRCAQPPWIDRPFSLVKNWGLARSCRESIH